MKRHSGWSLLLGLLVVIGVVGPVAAQQPRPGGTLRVAWEADISGLDPTSPLVCRRAWWWGISSTAWSPLIPS
jgi:hypothetical protein